MSWSAEQPPASKPAFSTGDRTRALVLVGAGHAHVEVLRSFALDPPPHTALTLVVDTPVAVYSGMVPGLIAGQYRADELEIDALILARRANAQVIAAAAEAVDAARRCIRIAGGPPVPYDVASFDIGSTVAGLDLPGVRAHALPTRPIGRFVQLAARALDGQRSGRGLRRVVVVGGGSGGVELAFVLHQRLAASGAVSVTLLHAGERLLTGYPASLVRRVERHAQRRGIAVRCGERVGGVTERELELATGEVLEHDLLVWVTGAASHPLFIASDLRTDERGFVRVRPTLQLEDHDELFASGDCASLTAHPNTPKAGVYAVRQGPILGANLRALLVGKSLADYRPQGDFLTLLNLGDGTALGSKSGYSFEGRAVLWLKDWIDRRFVRRFRSF